MKGLKRVYVVVRVPLSFHLIGQLFHLSVQKKFDSSPPSVTVVQLFVHGVEGINVQVLFKVCVKVDKSWVLCQNVSKSFKICPKLGEFLVR